MAEVHPAVEGGTFNPSWCFALTPPPPSQSSNVLIGCAVTCWALWGATKSIRSGDSYTAQKMFRMRLYGQFFTIVAMVAGSFYYNSDRILRKEYDGILKERKATEKRNAWIRELEARDKEEKDWREKVKEVTEKRKQEEDVARAKEEAKKGGGVVTKAVKGLRGRLTGEEEGKP